MFSPCVTFNHLNTYPWFKERVYKLDGEEGYDPTDLAAAIGKSFEFGSKIPSAVCTRWKNGATAPPTIPRRKP